MNSSTPENEKEIAMVPLASVEVAIAQYVRITTWLTVALVVSVCLPVLGWFAALLVGNARNGRKDKRGIKQ